MSDRIARARGPSGQDSDLAEEGNPPFVSILFPDGDGDVPVEPREAPDFFHDLSLGSVVKEITAGHEAYDLTPFFYTRLTTLDAIGYRQDVMRDMETPLLRQAIAAFARRLQTMRLRLPNGQKQFYEVERQRWFLAAVEIYVDAVEGLGHDLVALDLSSRGLRACRAYVTAYTTSEAFCTLADEARGLSAALAAIRYCVLIHDTTVTVLPYRGETDFSVTIEETFDKFQEGAVKDYRHKFPDSWGMNHVEAQIVDRVRLLFPESFATLDRFCRRHAGYLDPTIARFDREIQFYAAYLDHIERFRGAGLAFCYPRLSDQHKDVVAREAFDLALAERCLEERMPIVCNDIVLQGPERVCVVTGPNQGGKTTFARTVGQLHYLASLGCPVPGREARLFLYDRLFTHFGREEEIARQRGGLEDDLVRIHAILNQATPNSLLIINEIFSSTTLEDALYLGREVLTRIMRLDLLCVYVTFLDELSTLSEKTVSLVAAVDPEDPVRRTFRVERRKAHGLAYALAIAEKYRVTRRWLEERIRT